jgi:hypothetical protein
VWSFIYSHGPCKFSYSCARGVSLVGGMRIFIYR